MGCLGILFPTGRFKTLTITAAFALACYLVATGIAHAAVSGGTSETGEIKKVGYTTAKSNAKLKWLPYRPQSGDADEGVIQTQYVAQRSSPTPATISRQSAENAFDDPFGDKQSAGEVESVEEIGESLALTSAGPGGVSAQTNFPNAMKSSNPKSSIHHEYAMQSKANNFGNPNSQDQTLEQSLATRSPDLKDTCPTVKDLKKISQLSTNIAPSSGELPKDCPWGGDDFIPRAWSGVTFTWTASALSHKPLYFEDVQLERYGHMLGPWLQPFASGAHFFLTVPILPYKMGLELPNECIYTLGYYRPGSCAPYMLDPIPLSIRAGLFEAGAWIGAAAVIP